MELDEARRRLTVLGGINPRAQAAAETVLTELDWQTSRAEAAERALRDREAELAGLRGRCAGLEAERGVAETATVWLFTLRRAERERDVAHAERVAAERECAELRERCAELERVRRSPHPLVTVRVPGEVERAVELDAPRRLGRKIGNTRLPEGDPLPADTAEAIRALRERYPDKADLHRALYSRNEPLPADTTQDGIERVAADNAAIRDELAEPDG